MSKHVINISEFRTLFPAFADESVYPDASLEAYWGRSEMMIYAYDNWLISNGKLQYALSLLTAHIAALSSDIAAGGDGGGGVVQSASEGSVSVSMLAPEMKDYWQFWLAKTPYGQELLALLETVTLAGFYFGGSPETAAIRDVGGKF